MLKSHDFYFKKFNKVNYIKIFLKVKPVLGSRDNSHVVLSILDIAECGLLIFY